MPRPHLSLLAAGALVVLAPSVARAAEPTALSTIEQAVGATPAAGTACATRPVDREAVGARYTAPISGYLTARLQGKGDWDLVLRDDGGRRVGASQGTTGDEVVKTWIQAGQAVEAVACARSGATGTAMASFSLLDLAPEKQVGPSQLVDVQANKRELDRLEAAGFDVTHDVANGSAKVMVNGTDQTRALLRTGLKHKVVVADVAAKDRRARLADMRATRAATSARAAVAPTLPSGRTEYRTYESIEAELKDLADKNPDMARMVSIGKSYEGRDVTGLEIGKDVKGDDGRPVFFLMGVHHAREWPAAEAVMEYAQMLVKLKDDPTYKALLQNERTVLVPLVNPDGYIVSRDATSPGDVLGGDENITLVESIAPPGGFGAYRRKNCNPVTGAPTSCESAIGVDNNRNYGNLWGGPGASPDPTSQAFHGLSPRSEPETQNVYNYARLHHVTTLVTMHTVAALVLRPPGLAQLGLAPDEARMKQLGDQIAKEAGYVSQFSWQLYDTAGTTEDDTYAATGGYGYTIEMGPAGGGFHGTYQDNVVDQWTGEYAPAKAAGGGGLAKGLTEAAQVAADPADHAVLKGTAPAGKVLRLKKSFDTVTSPYCQVGAQPVLNTGMPPACVTQAPITLKDTVDTTTKVPANGSFDWHVNQSTRPFIGGGATLISTQTLSPPIKDQDGAGGTPMTDQDIPFTIPAAVDAARVTLSAKVPTDDFDIQVFRKEGGKLTSVGTSGQSPPSDEVVAFTPAPAGDYVVRVTNFAGLLSGFHLTVEGQRQKKTLTTGHTEAYTLTCEDPGGKVLETRDLTIARGQQMTVALGCGAAASTATAAPAQTPPVQPGSTAPATATPAKGLPFSTSTAVDRTSLNRARSEGLRVRLRANRAYSAVIQLRDARRRVLVTRRLPSLVGRRTVRITSKRISAIRSIKVTFTEKATGQSRTRVLTRVFKT